MESAWYPWNEPWYNPGEMKNHVKRSLMPENGAPLGSAKPTSNNAEQVLQIINEAYKCFVRDGLLSDQDYKYIVDRSTHEGLGFYTKTLPTLGKAFDKALGCSMFTLPSNFKALAKKGKAFAVPGEILVKRFLTVFSRDGALLAEPSVDSIRAIRQVCFYAYKADVPNDQKSNDRVVQDFVKCEEHLTTFVEDATLPGGVFCLSDSGAPLDPILAFAANAIASVTAGFDIEHIRPKHGPGATSDTPIPRKWLERPRLVNGHAQRGIGSQSQLLGTAGSYRWFNPDHCFDDPTAVKPMDLYEGWLKPPSRRRAKVILVPKDSRGPRLISAEPAYAQFIQQGIQRWMYNAIERHPYTAGHVNFTDQTVNRRLALKGSLSGEWATLDLKEASDRVTMALVSCLFSGNHSLLTAIHAVRSDFTVLPDGTELKLVKHAPMGSALCFPVMSLSIWSILVAGLIALGEKPSDATDSVYVYGDDIIVPARFYDVSIRLLERYGLLVNKAKSFRGKGFLESCGCDAFLGHDVTPVRLRKVWGLPHANDSRGDRRVATPLDVASVSFVAHGNELIAKGLYETAEYSFRLASKRLGEIPYVPVECELLGRKTENSHWWTVKDGYLSGYVVRSVATDFPCSPWDHLRRIESTIGTDAQPAFGVYELPRDWKLKKRKIPFHLLPAGKYPKWVETLP